MEKVRVNLDILVSGAVHCHNYKRVDGKLASNSKHVRESERQRGVYSSPRNVRKLFIKYTGVDIVYYRSVVGKGDALCESVKFSDADRKALVQYLMEKGEELSQTNPDRVSTVSLVGTGFASFLNDLSLSNLEELYFDWTLLLGNEQLLSQFFQINGAVKPGSVLGIEVAERERNCEINSCKQIKEKVVTAKALSANSWDTQVKLLATMLHNYISEEMCKGGSLVSKYSRLKYIGFVSNSNQVLKSEGGITKGELTGYEYHALFNNFSKNQIREALGAGEVFQFSLFFATNIDLYTAGFRADPNLYQFDKDFLVDYLKCDATQDGLTQEAELTRWFSGSGSTRLGLESKLKWAKKMNQGELIGQKRATATLETLEEGSTEGEVAEEVTDELEKSFEVLLATKGREEIKFQLSFLYDVYGSQVAVKQLLSQFTIAGKKKYTDLFEEQLKELSEKLRVKKQ